MAPIVNGRVYQCVKFTIGHHATHDGHQAIRQYLTKEFPKFASNHPDIQFELQLGNTKAPWVVADYADKTRRLFSLKGKTVEEIEETIHRLRDSSTAGQRRFINRPVQSVNPSIQGVWSPQLTFDDLRFRESKIKMQ